MKTYQYKVSEKEEGMKLLAFLRQKCADAPSVKGLKRAIDQKQCLINGRVELFSTHPVKKGENIQITLKEQTKKSLSCPILYEDEDIVIFNKPDGIASPDLAKHFSLRPVHRLDKDTSGIFLCAKHPQAEARFIQLFAEKKMNKTYHAIVDGLVFQDEGMIENYLEKKTSYDGGCLIGKASKGKKAITQWRCIRRGSKASFLHCIPVTGRTHQIRVHLKEIGHPILGDFQYGRHFSNDFRPHRQLLHAAEIQFSHPTKNKPITITAPYPEDFLEAKQKLFHE